MPSKRNFEEFSTSDFKDNSDDLAHFHIHSEFWRRRSAQGISNKNVKIHTSRSGCQTAIQVATPSVEDLATSTNEPELPDFIEPQHMQDIADDEETGPRRKRGGAGVSQLILHVKCH